MTFFFLSTFYIAGAFGTWKGCKGEVGDWILIIAWPIIAAIVIGHWVAQYDLSPKEEKK